MSNHNKIIFVLALGAAHILTINTCKLVIVNGNWGRWGSFGQCNKGCIKTRTRACDNPPPSANGSKCTGGNGLQQMNRVKCNPNFCSKSSHLIQTA